MSLVSPTCPKCGATLSPRQAAAAYRCDFCGQMFEVEIAAPLQLPAGMRAATPEEAAALNRFNEQAERGIVDMVAAEKVSPAFADRIRAGTRGAEVREVVRHVVAPGIIATEWKTGPTRTKTARRDLPTGPVKFVVLLTVAASILGALGLVGVAPFVPWLKELTGPFVCPPNYDHTEVSVKVANVSHGSSSGTRIRSELYCVDNRSKDAVVDDVSVYTTLGFEGLVLWGILGLIGGIAVVRMKGGVPTLPS